MSAASTGAAHASARAGRDRGARSPYVLDVRELGRRPGSMRPVSVSLPAPSDWSVGIATVAAQSPVDLDVRLESVVEGVLVTGTATLDYAAECGRCLETVTDSLTVDVQELFTYSPTPSGETEDDDPLPMLDGDSLDLEPTLRDAVVLGLPVSPVCSEDCEGLCPTCGERLVILPDDHEHAASDPRWAALLTLTESTTPTSTPNQEH